MANRTAKINQKRPHVWFDLQMEDRVLGRVTFELFGDLCPKTAENFRRLCVGDILGRVSKKAKKPLKYEGSAFHRIIPGFMIQGGDFDFANGTGGESIYGSSFDDENFLMNHDKSGMLSMANSGKHTNASQFFITLKEAPHLDGKHVVF